MRARFSRDTRGSHFLATLFFSTLLLGPHENAFFSEAAGVMACSPG